MICPECKAADLKSTVTSGGTTRTLMATHEYWDEDGKHHFDDPNKSTTYYRCSNGHQWMETK